MNAIIAINGTARPKSRDERHQAVLGLASLGFLLVPLGDAGTSKAKIPRFKNWGSKATSDEDEIVGLLEKYPDANWGVLLGPQGGIIDVEFDCEEGRATADRLLGESITPTYRSKRSTHRLYKHNDSLPPQQKKEWNGLEIRLGGGDKQTQSVLPPSVHPDGTSYEWLPGLSPDEVDLAELPEAIAVAFCNVEAGLEAGGLTESCGESRDQEHWDRITHGTSEGGRNEAMTSLAGRLLCSVADLDDSQIVGIQYEAFLAINERNSPPLPEPEAKAIFKSILGRERKRREADELEMGLTPAPSRLPAGGGGNNGSERPQQQESVAGFRMEIVTSDPTVFRLTHDAWGDRWLSLYSNQLPSFTAVNRAAVETLHRALPDGLKKKWPKLYAKLLAVAPKLPPDPEAHVPSIIANILLERAALSRHDKDVTPERVADSASLAGGFGLTVDGGAIARLTDATSLVQHEGLPEAKRSDLIAVLKGVGGESRNVRGKERRARLWILDKPAADRLRRLAEGDFSESLDALRSAEARASGTLGSRRNTAWGDLR